MDMRNKFFRRGVLLANWLIVMSLLIPWLLSPATALAQGPNLLNNPNFEQPHGRDYAHRTEPPGWSLWTTGNSTGWSDVEPITRQAQRGDAEVSAALGVHEGNGAFDAFKGWATFGVALYQTVSGIQPGTTLRLSAYGRIWSCNNNLIDSDDCLGGRIESNTAANFRVGIDPTGGNNPNSGSIVWSTPIAPYSGFQEASVEATASGGSVTVVLYAHMDLPARHQHVYWDQASLTATTGSAAAPGGQPQPTATPVPALAPIVYPQGPREDGSVVHVVGQGDTLLSIAVAYGISVHELAELNGIAPDTRIIQPGQEFIVRPAPLIPGGNDEGTAVADSSSAPEGGEGGGEGQPTGADTSGEPTQQPIEEYPPAPVAEAGIPAINPVAGANGQVCTLLFEDINPNRIRESGEGLLAGGDIVLTRDGAMLESYTTDGLNEPHCFASLEAGEYMVTVMPPSGYAVTTAENYTLRVNAGQAVQAIFGAAAGYVPSMPSSGGGTLISQEQGTETDTQSLTDTILENSGVIVLVLAGIVLVGGIILALIFRR